MKKPKGADNSNTTLSECNCLNCRLGRIEDQLSHMQNALESINKPANPGKSSKNKRKRK